MPPAGPYVRGDQGFDGGDEDGMRHYRVLGLPRTASAEDIKQAYRRLARTCHPDKGGSAQGFAALQNVFETLNNPKARSVYDALAADARFRPGAAAPYRPGVPRDPCQPPPAPPGVTEAALLQQLLRRCHAAFTDPATQLCITCEVCRRPATKECWTCGMHICDFCTRRQHWKGTVPLHWPLVNAPNRLIEQLGRQELERKRKEDGQAYLMTQPGYRPMPEVLVLRQFQDAIISMLATARTAPATAPAAPVTAVCSKSSTTATSGSSAFAISASAASITRVNPPATAAPSAVTAGVLATTTSSGGGSSGSIVSSRAASPAASQNSCFRAWTAAAAETIQQLQACHDPRLSRFYMWAQTESFVLLTLHLPTGGTSTPPKLDIHASSSTIRVQHQGFAPVLCRAWSREADSTASLSSWVSGDGRLLGLVVPKAVPGQVWTSCFKGDSYAARCLCSPYSLLQLPHEVQLELPLPFWVDPTEDVQVTFKGQRSLRVSVEGLLQLERHYCRDEAAAARLGDSYKVVDAGASSWVVTEGDDCKQGASGPQQAAFFPPASRAAAAASSAGAAAAAAGAGRRPAAKLLSITIALPGLTEEEILYKKGVRQNNAAAARSCSHGCGQRGFAFFAEDEDEFGLAALLQALQMHVAGYAWLCKPRPWEVVSSSPHAGRWVAEADGSALPAEVAAHLSWLGRQSEPE